MCWPSPQAVQLCSQGSEKLAYSSHIAPWTFPPPFQASSSLPSPRCPSPRFPMCPHSLVEDVWTKMHAPGAEEQILPTASGPAKEILLCKYTISGETNNLHPQRACVSFAEKADGTKAFVTATELVAASLQEERALSTYSTLRGNKPTNLTTKNKTTFFFLAVDLSSWKTFAVALGNRWHMGDTCVHGWKYLKRALSVWTGPAIADDTGM